MPSTPDASDAFLRRDRFSSALLGMLENVRGGALARDVMTAETNELAEHLYDDYRVAMEVPA